ncbi:MAG: hypothetical protein K2J84_08560 [Bacteroidaceae bacterium]|nr:hypothetical protein [Bacteroidaceae bacterium]
MRRIVLSIALALCVGSGAFGQTAEKLIAKWKKVQGAEYENMTKNGCDSFIVSQEPDTDLTAEDIELLRKSFKKSEQVQFLLEEDRREELEQDIRKLKGYETLVVLNHNHEPDDSLNMFQRMFDSVFSLSYKVALYGKMKGDIVYDIFGRIDLWDKVSLVHIKCKMHKDKLLKTILLDSNEDDDNGDEEYRKAGLKVKVTEDLSWKNVTKDVENGNVLFVIHGEEHPELHSIEEVKNYMIANNIHWNKEHWIVGGSVKEIYPRTDRKVVVEFSEQEKEKDAE